MKGCLTRCFLIILVGCMIFCALTGYTFYNFKRENPEGYSAFLTESLGVNPNNQSRYSYELTSDETTAAANIGINDATVARASATERWGYAYGISVGRPVLIALTGAESADCSNAGGADAETELTARGWPNQVVFLHNFLDLWEFNDTQTTNPIADRYINDLYTAVEGSRGAGAIGCSQFLPGTAWPHCDVVGGACDLFDPDTAMKMMALELSRCGWSEEADFATKLSAMYCWNRDYGYGERVINTAQDIASYLGTTRGISRVYNSGENTAPELLVWALDRFNLLPEVSGSDTISGTISATSVFTDGVVTLSASEVPQGDVEWGNVVLWAQNNPSITIQPGQQLNFCTQTSISGGWAQYGSASGLQGFGLCFMGSVLYDLSTVDTRLTVVDRTNDTNQARRSSWPRHNTWIECGTDDLIFQNASSEAITIMISYDQSTNQLSLKITP